MQGASHSQSSGNHKQHRCTGNAAPPANARAPPHHTHRSVRFGSHTQQQAHTQRRRDGNSAHSWPRSRGKPGKGKGGGSGKKGGKKGKHSGHPGFHSQSDYTFTWTVSDRDNAFVDGDDSEYEEVIFEVGGNSENGFDFFEQVFGGDVRGGGRHPRTSSQWATFDELFGTAAGGGTSGLDPEFVRWAAEQRQAEREERARGTRKQRRKSKRSFGFNFMADEDDDFFGDGGSTSDDAADFEAHFRPFGGGGFGGRRGGAMFMDEDGNVYYADDAGMPNFGGGGFGAFWGAHARDQQHDPFRGAGRGTGSRRSTRDRGAPPPPPFGFAAGGPRREIAMHLENLGIAELPATRGELKRAYNAAAKKFHPDMTKSGEASAARFHKATLAYEYLQAHVT